MFLSVYMLFALVLGANWLQSSGRLVFRAAIVSIVCQVIYGLVINIILGQFVPDIYPFGKALLDWVYAHIYMLSILFAIVGGLMVFGAISLKHPEPLTAPQNTIRFAVWAIWWSFITGGGLSFNKVGIPPEMQIIIGGLFSLVFFEVLRKTVPYEYNVEGLTAFETTEPGIHIPSEDVAAVGGVSFFTDEHPAYWAYPNDGNDEPTDIGNSSNI